MEPCVWRTQSEAQGEAGGSNMLRGMGAEGQGKRPILAETLVLLHTYGHLPQLLTMGLTSPCVADMWSEHSSWLALVSANFLTALLCLDRKCLEELLPEMWEVFGVTMPCSCLPQCLSPFIPFLSKAAWRGGVPVPPWTQMLSHGT